MSDTFYIPVDLDALVDEVASRLSGDYILPRLMSVRNAGTYIGRSESGVWGLIRKGELKTVKSDRRTMLDRVDLDLWIAEKKG